MEAAKKGPWAIVQAALTIGVITAQSISALKDIAEAEKELGYDGSPAYDTGGGGDTGDDYEQYTPASTSSGSSTVRKIQIDFNINLNAEGVTVIDKEDFFEETRKALNYAVTTLNKKVIASEVLV